MDQSTIIALIALMLTLITLVAGGVWVVGKIRTTAEVLGVIIKALTRSLNRLEAKLETVDTKQDDHEVRITVLEMEKQKPGD